MKKPKTLDQLQAEKEQAETQLAQEQHKLERLENKKKYLEKGETKRPPSKIALDERSGIVFGCARRLGTECRALRSQAGAAKG